MDVKGYFPKLQCVQFYINSVLEYLLFLKSSNRTFSFGSYASKAFLTFQFSSVQSLSRVRLFATPWIAACQASLSITNSWSSLKLMSIESVMPSSHLILCRPLLLLPPVPPSIRVFSNESTLRMRWPKYWSFSFSISPSKEHPAVKPSGPGLLFAGRFFITVSISVFLWEAPFLLLLQ